MVQNENFIILIFPFTLLEFDFFKNYFILFGFVIPGL